MSVYAPAQNPPPLVLRVFLQGRQTFGVLVKIPYYCVVADFEILICPYTLGPKSTSAPVQNPPPPLSVTNFEVGTYYKEKPKGGIPYGPL